ncbi:MAG: shikimate kinase AroL [Deltaproteobacteria bacterium]|nr:shikimate kinase AroL [Deltaproteobacteria bacterium]
MRIAIIGYRGVGKTSLGRALAHKMGIAFFDIDELVVAATGKTIAAIVTTEGWQAFRVAEKQQLAKVALLEECLIATGGGTVLDVENQRIIKEMDEVIWLCTDIKTIVGRIRNDVASLQNRPCLLDEDLEAETHILLCQREALYRALASITLTTDGKSIEEIADLIMETIQRKEANDGRKLHRTTV